MSAREDIRNEIAEFCANNRLNEVYGCIDGTQTPKSNPKAIMAYTTTFCRARITDGKVAVYSPTKIEVTWQTANRTLPRDGKETFTNKDLAMAFLLEYFG